MILALFILALFLLNYASKYICKTDRTKNSNLCTDIVAGIACAIMISSIVWILRLK